MRLGAIVLDSDNSKALADFYQKLLGWAECLDDWEMNALADFKEELNKSERQNKQPEEERAERTRRL